MMAVRLRRVAAFVLLFSLFGALIAACGNTGGGQGGEGGAGGAGGGAGAAATTGTGGGTEGGGAAATTGAETGGAATEATAAGGGAETGGAAATTAAGGGTEAGATTAAGGAGAGATTAAGGAGGGAAQAAECPSTAQGASITMWSPLTGPDGKFMTDLANRFSQDNPQGIKVQHLPQPEYLQKLNTAAAGKSLPEMTVIRADDIAEMAARNVLKPMSEAALGAAGGSAVAGEFPEQVWNIGEYKGQRYAFPLDVHPLVLYYNKDLFKAAGLPEPGKEPMSGADFEKAAEALNKNGVAGWAIGTLFSADTLFQTLLRQYGGTVTNQDGTEAAYNSEQGVRALTYIKDMKAKYTPQVSGAGDPEAKLFQQGKAGMVLHGPWHISDMQKLPFVGFAPVPKWGDQYAVWGGSHQLGLTTDDPAKQAAAGCWISWLSTNSVEWAKAGQLPVRESARQGNALETAAAPIAAIAAEAEAVVMLPSVPGIGASTIGEASKSIAAVLAGQQQDVKKALDDAANRSNQLLKQNAQRYAGGQ